MCGEIRELIDLYLFGALQEPAEVIPELGRMADVGGADMGEFMESDERDDVLADELFALVALTETHIDLLSFINGVGRVGGVGGGL